MINHDTMTELEMVSSYRQAARKAKQIRVLADLGLCSAEEIIEMLRRHGETVRSRTIRTLYADGAIPLLSDDPPEPEPEPVSNLDTEPEQREEISVPALPCLCLTAAETADLRRLLDRVWAHDPDGSAIAALGVATVLDFLLRTRCGDAD
jgi:hypothetical protein